jgi:hypothetical protein
MAVIKFPCSLCQKLMAVGPELTGRRVRCPHCHQVIVALTAAPVPASEDPFQFTKSTDGQDNIFGEAADDDPFGNPSKPVFQPAPPPEPVVDSNPFVAKDVGPFIASPRSTGHDDDRSERPSPINRRPKEQGRPPGMLLAILVPYAACMTILAIYYFVKYSSAVQQHPLEMIPDLMGEFQKDIKKDGKPVVRAIKLPPADQPLPDKLVTSLGRPITVGAIEVTPISIEYRTWTGFTKRKGRDGVEKKPIGKTLVLHVRLRNTSTNLTFYPIDPYFDRRPKHPNDKPYTLVDTGGKKFFGGAIEFVTESGSAERDWLDGQEEQPRPLGPGESRETVFVTNPREGVFDAIQKSKGQAVWRIQVRRGLVPYQGTEIPASAVVGVAFTAADVKRVG